MKGRVRWDEANLDEINTNKPVRRKIDEPKTPYHPMPEEDGSNSPASDSSGSISYPVHAEAIRSALNKVVISANNSRRFERLASSDDEDNARNMEEGSIKDGRAMDFEEYRRAHYDEFKKVKELQKKGFLLQYEDDYSQHEGGNSSSSSPSIDAREVHSDSDDEILKTIDIQGD